jgi:hypothetical protein
VLKDASETSVDMMDARSRALLARYVLDRECVQGGFCFYKLDEPNGSDTWFAISILHVLDIPFDSEKTRRYLCNLQQPDGTFDSLYAACYAVKSLQLLKDAPPRNATSFVYNHLEKFIFSPDRLPPDIMSMFKRLRYLLELMDTLRLEIDHETTTGMIRFVLSFRNADGGFGHGRSCLSDTTETLQILRRLAYPVADLQAHDFIRLCETPTAGFTNVPGTSLSSIEAVHDGLLCVTLVSCMPRYLNDCVKFIRFCRNKTGGFARHACTGIATLENSFYAVHALRYAQMLEKRNDLRPGMKNAPGWRPGQQN